MPCNALLDLRQRTWIILSFPDVLSTFLRNSMDRLRVKFNEMVKIAADAVRWSADPHQGPARFISPK